MAQSESTLSGIDALISHRKNKPSCPACGNRGEVLYTNLRDGLFNAPGVWGMQSCSQTNCGMVWLDPAPSPETIHLAYASYYTHSDNSAPEARKRPKGLKKIWKRRIIRPLQKWRAAAESQYRVARYADATINPFKGLSWWKYFFYLFPNTRAEVDFSYMFMPVKTGARLLEVGCGSGWLLKLMQERGWNAHGVDFDDNAIAHARSQGLNVRLGDLAAQDYAPQSFDAIVGSHLIEHLPDPQAFLKTCHGLLATDGAVVLVTPNPRSFGHRWFKHHWRGLEPPRHFQLFTAESMQSMAQRAGFSHCEIRYSLRDAHQLFQASRNLATRGWHRHGEKVSAFNVCRSIALQMLELLLMKFDARFGEELVVILRKNKS